ncbi:hypothetical protein [Methylobacterium brachiatum]|uniref:hypothetical protein n=1 Tax=Methylobacterium brachiatum TaxID=269660 RepID=UPI0026C756AF
MAIVRAHLETFEQMHRDGASWVDIAAGLAAQGVMQGTGEAAQPITARRLTALMASVRRERERRARSDLGVEWREAVRDVGVEQDAGFGAVAGVAIGARLNLTGDYI